MRKREERGAKVETRSGYWRLHFIVSHSLSRVCTVVIFTWRLSSGWLVHSVVFFFCNFSLWFLRKCRAKLKSAKKKAEAATGRGRSELSQVFLFLSSLFLSFSASLDLCDFLPPFHRIMPL